jgi:hypothetical protein
VSKSLCGHHAAVFLTCSDNTFLLLRFGLTEEDFVRSLYICLIGWWGFDKLGVWRERGRREVLVVRESEEWSWSLG